MTSIRENYIEKGVAAYYSDYGNEYENPHAQDVIKCLRYFYQKDKHQKILDLACGDGLITKWIGNKSDVIGVDGYLHKRYTIETGKKCYPYTFANICDFNNSIENNFDLIIFSYAIDLVETSYIQQLLYRLSLISKELLIIRPNKHLINSPFWDYQRFHYEGKAKATLYESTYKQK